MKAAAIYVRVSTDMQTELSPDSQRKLALEYCAKNDLEVFGIYSDEGISGRKAEKRPEFQRMIADAKAGAFSVVVVWKFSRFARNMEESLVYKNALKRHGVEVASISEPIPDGPIGALIERIFEWMDEYYSINLSQEVKRGLRERAARGLPVGSLPFGYAMDGSEVVIDEERAPVIREIFRAAANGESVASIVSRLNGRGETAKRGRWSRTTVKQILANARFTGARCEGVDGVSMLELPAIVSQAEFEAVARMREGAREKYFRQLPPDIGRSWVQGVVVCASCGRALGQNLKDYKGHYYRRLICRNPECSDFRHLSVASKVEDALLEALRRVLGGIDAPRRVPRVVYSVDDEKARKRLEERLERCMAAYQAGVDTLEEYKAAKADILEKLEALKKEPEPAPLPSLSGVLDILEGDALTDEKRAAALSVIDRAVFDFSERRLNVFFL